MTGSAPPNDPRQRPVCASSRPDWTASTRLGSRARSGRRRPRRSRRWPGRRRRCCPGRTRSRSVPRTGRGPEPGSPPDPGVDGHQARGHGVDVGRALPVAQLADIEVALLSVEPGDPCQPRKMSLDACIRRWPATTRWPVWVLALADEPFQHRLLGLLGLQEQRVRSSRPSIRAIQARVPTLPTPTTLRAKWTYRRPR